MKSKNETKQKVRDNGRKQVVVLVPPDILDKYDSALLKQYKVGGKRSQHLLAMIESFIAASTGERHEILN